MALESKQGRGLEGLSGGWEKRRRGSVGDGKRKYCCVLLESGGYHGDGVKTEGDGRKRLAPYANIYIQCKLTFSPADKIM